MYKYTDMIYHDEPIRLYYNEPKPDYARISAVSALKDAVDRLYSVALPQDDVKVYVEHRLVHQFRIESINDIDNLLNEALVNTISQELKKEGYILIEVTLFNQERRC